MKSVISRSPFSRSPRNIQDPTLSSYTHSHNQSTSAPPQGSSSTLRPDTLRRGYSMSNDFRNVKRLERRMIMEQEHYLKSRSRAQNYNPPVDLRLLEYVSSYDTNLMCPICRCPFVDPIVLPECDHCFCRDCIRQTWSTNASYSPLGPRGNCPTCRTPAKLGPRSATSKILVNLTDDLLVKCPKMEAGCKAEVKRGEVQDHVNIYCSYALVECADRACDLPVRRKDVAQACLHFGVSCLSCHKEMHMWKLEAHWRDHCPDRKIHCDLCRSPVQYRDIEEHTKQQCPANTIPCPGADIGCLNRSRRGQAEAHAKGCPLAKLAPVMAKQQERLDEQEAAQKQMNRKLEVLETGFASMQDVLFPSPPARNRDSYGNCPDERLSRTRIRQSSTPSLDAQISPPTSYSSPTSPRAAFPDTEPGSNYLGLQPVPSDPSSPGQHSIGPPESHTDDFSTNGPTLSSPSPTTAPYTSPLHHLLSLHESLRDEITRISTALSELDGRHSMQNLNENLRTREEISYLAATVGGLQRQVHWLTSTQLQRQQQQGGGNGAGVEKSGVGVGLDEAVGTAATALRGAARVVNVGGGGREGMGMLRRGPSEEGRTKL